MNSLKSNPNSRLSSVDKNTQTKQQQSLINLLTAYSPNMQKIITLITQISIVDSTVLLQGPSGVGKSLISKIIHDNSLRKGKPFITIDCATLPPPLLESELFGYEGGSFTGAEKKGKTGFIELANCGTLFLDEISELPLGLQAKLLRVLQNREIFKVGGNKPIPVDIRIISATNRNLSKLVKQKLFRNDLYYRLKVIPITIPSLQERKEDIIPLTNLFIDQFNENYGFQKTLHPAVYEQILDYSWPGNIRELENAIEYMIVTSKKDTIDPSALQAFIKDSPSSNTVNMTVFTGLTLSEAKDNFEKQLLLDVMSKTKSTLEMANLLGLDRSNITRKLNKYNIIPDFHVQP
ncbi:MAG: sigma 54-interacting transcriptional regulator [Eubacteriales bacterium]|nr:sigma 54-interacting transcriptional regulator [Eubacteriales bacterium]